VLTALAAAVAADPETAGNLKLQAYNRSGCLIGAPSIFPIFQSRFIENNTSDCGADIKWGALRQLDCS
jgi:hypothetical protein